MTMCVGQSNYITTAYIRGKQLRCQLCGKITLIIRQRLSENSISNNNIHIQNIIFGLRKMMAEEQQT